MNAVDLEYGLQYMFNEWFIWAGIIKSLFFAFIIASPRIVPNSEAMFDPTFPARIRHIIEEENSSNIISRVT